jgi:hypothetical protein
VFDAGVRILEVGAALADRLDLAADEDDPAFVGVDDVVVVERPAVADRHPFLGLARHRSHCTDGR